MAAHERFTEFNHKLLNILDEYADVIAFPAIQVREKIGPSIHGYPLKGPKEIEFTVSFKYEDDLNTVESKIKSEHAALLKDIKKEMIDDIEKEINR